jgi:hypothetical protein
VDERARGGSDRAAIAASRVGVDCSSPEAALLIAAIWRACGRLLMSERRGARFEGQRHMEEKSIGLALRYTGSGGVCASELG